MSMRTSRISGFYNLSVEERLRIVKEFADLTDEEVEVLRSGKLTIEIADHMIENVVGLYSLPFAVATNFLINGKDYLIPMVIEEPSVVAAASNAAKMARESGGFEANATESIMISQIQVVKVPNLEEARSRILAEKERLLASANEMDPLLTKLGGGARDLEVRVVESDTEPMLIVHLLVDTLDAMGANTVNTMAEGLAPTIERLTGGRVYLRIISNLADRRLARAKAKFSKAAIGGEEVVEGIMWAYRFAKYDPYRAATHNKGIMNGIIAVALATGQDTRALEAGAHSYAARSGKYTTLTDYWVDENGDLWGSIEVPMAVGTVGGVVRVHPIAKVALRILGVERARELAMVMASVGLAQNFAALRALATEGIQAGHMKLHARNIAMSVGATPSEVDDVVERMLREKKISVERAKQILEEIRSGKKA
ncbi:MAG: hydroxymethylglutaryl-CoA reductase, degradative [Candidatus Korarchaeum sp.]|nr:hydroxymethylglutaryl-CoA reductase, degradative [Candidatus Korarchaeum sp.]MDW8035552.1 hydroxymethylglutaryl-CoA reductase, degradative [Candidatus Korarchaeum sp.]